MMPIRTTRFAPTCLVVVALLASACGASPEEDVSAAEASITSPSTWTAIALPEAVFDFASGAPLDHNGANVATRRRFASGPCQEAISAQQPCVLDTRTFLSNGVESITAYGRAWNYDRAGQPWPSNGLSLTDVPRYASGPCSKRPSGAPCTFETRVVKPDGTEIITAYGRVWEFVNGTAVAGTGADLRTVPPFSTGPCRGAAFPCTLDTRAILRDGTDSMTAYGRAWNYRSDGTPWPGNGVDLKTVRRYAEGPCRHAPPGKPCTMRTRAFFVEASGAEIESVTSPTPTGAPSWEPDYWSGDVQANSNCYSYALNRRKSAGGFATPGVAAGFSQDLVKCDEKAPDGFWQRLAADGLVRSSRDETCPSGMSKIAAECVMWPFANWHFFRQDADGAWSEKNAGYRPIRTTEHGGSPGPEWYDAQTGNGVRYYCTWSDPAQGMGHVHAL
jgi:hypothetical protein